MTLFDRLRDVIATGTPVVLATVVGGPSTGDKAIVVGDGSVEGSLGNADLERVVVRDALGELAAGWTGVRHYGEHGEAREDVVTVFFETFAPPPQMLVFGAVDFTAALVRVAKVLGYRVTVCDAREVFATRKRFPFADEVVVDWPHRLLEAVGPTLGPSDAICVLTHDAKFDVPALVAALETDAGYIGAMGSRRTHDERMVRLREAGMDDAGLARIRAPIGLDIAARTPEETAISICAEIIASCGPDDRPVRSAAPKAQSIERAKRRTRTSTDRRRPTARTQIGRTGGILTGYRAFEIHRRAFGPVQCRRIIELGRGLGGTRGILVDGSGPNRDVRDSSTAWIPRGDETEWIFDRLWTVATKANRRYRFDLDGFVEDLQFTTYDRPGAFYTWHQDGLETSVAHRKLSIVVQLSDPSEYTGGELELFEVDADYGDAEREAFRRDVDAVGTAVVFPAFEMHRVLPMRSGVRHSLVCWVGGPPFH